MKSNTSARTTMLAALLLALVLAYLAVQLWGTPYLPGTSISTAEAPSPGGNKLGHLTVAKSTDGKWMATLDYFFTGAPPSAYITLDLGGDVDPVAPTRPSGGSAYLRMERGQHQIVVELQRPSIIDASITKTVSANMRASNAVLETVKISQAIDWPDLQTDMMERDLAGKGPDELLNRAVALIDANDNYATHQSKVLLERILSKDPKYAPAYVELARIAMKTNWGPEGLHQAESLLDSALQIRPGDINANILLAYVYAHQGHFEKAEALNVAASKSDPPNQWLWTNWGEALEMQGKVEPAIQKYREGLGHARTTPPNDRARIDAYRRLLLILAARKDVAGQEELYKQRATEFGPGSCYSADYAIFILKQRGDSSSSMVRAREAVDGHCQGPEARTALGLAYYQAWATGPEADRAAALNQARVYLPPGPAVLYLLAGSESTAVTVKRLLSAGESIEQKDNQKMNPLAYALQARDYPAARRLIQMGARRDAPVGELDMPVALLPVMMGDVDGVKAMQRSGVDYSKLKFQGTTAVEEVRKSGDRKMLEALDPTGHSS